MAKKAQKHRRRPTNWWVIGGVIIAGVLFLGLMALALRGPEQQQLANYCQQNPQNCVAEGDANAPVTIVEVSDYGCSHCRDFNLETANQIHDQFVASGQVQWVVMPFALTNQSGQAPTMATAVSAMCAAEQDKFPQYHRAVFNLQNTPLFNTREGFLATAEAVGLDTDSFANCLADNDYEDIIRRNIQMATAVGITGTPSFAIGADVLSGAYPFSVFQQRITTLLGE